MPSDPGDRGFRTAAFGLRWQSDIPLTPVFGPDAADGAADIRVCHEAPLPERGGGAPLLRGQVFADGVRFAAGGSATFDLVDGDCITYCPGPAWRGELPIAFFGSVAALTLAWRGIAPFHACAVEQDGRAILIAGAGGAGKSSLTAGLLALGLRFVADDLSAVALAAGACRVFPGRQTMRLHADLAAMIDAVDRQPVSGDPRGKWRVRPVLRTAATSLPLAGMIVLGAQPGPVAGQARFPLLRAQLFRPRWLQALPGYRALLTGVIDSAATMPIIGFPPITAFAAAHQRARAQAALAAIATLPS